MDNEIYKAENAIEEALEHYKRCVEKEIEKESFLEFFDSWIENEAEELYLSFQDKLTKLNKSEDYLPIVLIELISYAIKKNILILDTMVRTGDNTMVSRKFDYITEVDAGLVSFKRKDNGQEIFLSTNREATQ